MPQKICKDGRIWGQNNKEAGSHLGVASNEGYKGYIRKLTDRENRERWKSYGKETRYLKGQHYSVNTEFKKGKEHPYWRGGISVLPYPPKFDKELKEKIRERDNYQCQNKDCNMTEEEHLVVYGYALSIHHIDYDKDNCEELNLISLCRQCNTRVNHNRDYWKEYFVSKEGINASVGL